MPDIILYGISNCDTIKKARRWLEQHQINYRFHDFRKDGLNAETITSWLPHIQWQDLINKRGRTWRELSEADKQVDTSAQAVALCKANPTLIKRPVLVNGNSVTIGFDSKHYAKLFDT